MQLRPKKSTIGLSSTMGRFTVLEGSFSNYVFTSDHHQSKLVCNIAALLLSCSLTIFYWSSNPDFNDSQFGCLYFLIFLLITPSFFSLLAWYCKSPPKLSKGPNHPHAQTTSLNTSTEWTANRRNTTWTAAITAIVMPILVLLIWRSELQNVEIVVHKDEVVSSSSNAFHHRWLTMHNPSHSRQCSILLSR